MFTTHFPGNGNHTTYKNGDFPAGYEIVLPTVGKDCTVARWSVEQSKTAPLVNV